MQQPTDRNCGSACGNNISAANVTLGIIVRRALGVIPVLAIPIDYNTVLAINLFHVVWLARGPVRVHRTRSVFPLELSFHNSVGESDEGTRLPGQGVDKCILFRIVNACQLTTRSFTIGLHLRIIEAILRIKMVTTIPLRLPIGSGAWV